MALADRDADRHADRHAGAVLLDKDGTLIEDVPYNADPRRIRLAPHAATALRCLGATGMPLVVVSNQPGVALGCFRSESLVLVQQRLAELFRANGARLDGFFYCPHHPDGRLPGLRARCLCRKPAPGMLLQAAAWLHFDLKHSWMIGDILDDIEAGRRAGCTTILVDNGNETEWRIDSWREPDYTVQDLDMAARLVERAGRPGAGPGGEQP
ncbi:D-glycero-alpha-D-manno-heptose-1,7-bisphosphate 7-phosphatase [Cupriavidus malaysiensis]|uniref:D,D-heptose 1,7-bisphosphate phosphatase n=1 Tax=Cupriavidus malaysiensis TaxID=367825 RepID=A0ABM6FFB7_9BURK|nr:HAD family hydrolase [Cupriavidus malaysiensis]AOZ10602.1 hypothetical protein BKK80_34250 [Cupriavidus malaysiensis]